MPGNKLFVTLFLEVQIEDVLRDLKAIAHTDLQTLFEESGIQARWPASSGRWSCS